MTSSESSGKCCGLRYGRGRSSGGCCGDPYPDDVLTVGEEGVYINIHVQPKARRPGVRGVHGERLKIAVADPAEGGRANEAAVEAVASLFSVTTSAVSLVAGKTSRRKRLLVRGIHLDEALELIAAATARSDPS